MFSSYCLTDSGGVLEVLAQIFLILCLSLIVYVSRNFESLRFRIFSRVAFTAVVLVSIVAVLFPEITSRIANSLGIGRGSDLVFYLSTLSQIGLIGILMAKFRELDSRMSKIVRELSLLKIDEGVRKETK